MVAPLNPEDKDNEKDTDTKKEATVVESVGVVNEEKIVENIMKEEIDLRQLGNILYKKKKTSSKVCIFDVILFISIYYDSI